MAPAIALAAAVVPALLLMRFFHTRDRHPEPRRVVWVTFGLGVAAVVPVLALGLPLVRLAAGLADPWAAGLVLAFGSAAGPEELVKFLVLLGYAARHREFDEPMDGLVYGAAASLGFATAENLVYVSTGGLGAALVRAVTAVPMHGLLGVLMGSLLARARFHPEHRRRFLARALAIPVLLHGLYDFPLLALEAHRGRNLTPGELLLAGELLMLPVAVLGVCLTWALVSLRRLRSEQLTAARPAARPA